MGRACSTNEEEVEGIYDIGGKAGRKKIIGKTMT
jgi:hypothetical protein